MGFSTASHEHTFTPPRYPSASFQPFGQIPSPSVLVLNYRGEAIVNPYPNHTSSLYSHFQQLVHRFRSLQSLPPITQTRYNSTPVASPPSTAPYHQSAPSTQPFMNLNLGGTVRVTYKRKKIVAHKPVRPPKTVRVSAFNEAQPHIGPSKVTKRRTNWRRPQRTNQPETSSSQPHHDHTNA